MADFNTHVLAGVALGSLGATAATRLLALPVQDAIALTIVATIGGVLPDIDLRYSRPSQVLFTVLGAVAAVIVMFSGLFHELARWSVLSLWVLALLVYLIVRYPLWYLVHTQTTHRGALHSLVAAIMFAAVTSAACFQTTLADAAQSWLLGLFLGAGYLCHLVLDEIYSVDFLGVRMKRSFGSAMKPVAITGSQLPASCLMVFALLVAWFFLPPAASLTELASSVRIAEWRSQLLPAWMQLTTAP